MKTLPLIAAAALLGLAACGESPTEQALESAQPKTPTNIDSPGDAVKEAVKDTAEAAKEAGKDTAEAARATVDAAQGQAPAEGVSNAKDGANDEDLAGGTRPAQ